MTAARQQRKRRQALGLAWILAVLLVLVVPVAWAAEDQVVSDSNTGLALGGADPVAYFTDARPLFGRPELELSKFGTVWRFRNEGNRAAFIANPDIYKPRFGGYDPVAVGRGRSVPGHPLYWVVYGERLYLFFTEEARAAFLAEPDQILATAERKWPEVVRTIGR